MLRVLVIVAALAGPAAADGTIGDKVIDCYCTDTQGERVELEQFICLTVGGRTFTAQCQMALNVPIWKEIHPGCVSSALPQSFQPAIDTGLVDPQIGPSKTQS